MDVEQPAFWCLLAGTSIRSCCRDSPRRSTSTRRRSEPTESTESESLGPFEELQEVLEATLRDLDTEVMKSAFPFSGCSALLALLLGNRFVVAGVGDCRVLLLEGEGKGAQATRLLDCDGRLSEEEEQLRVWRSGGMAPWT